MPAPPPASEVSSLASDLRVVIGRLVRRLRAQHSFSLTHGAVLGRLDREGARSTAELAAAEHVRPQSMGQTLAELEADGLIVRRPDPSDGRRALLELTPEGRRVLEEERRRREGWLAAELEERLTPAEREHLAEAVRLLERLAEL